MLKINLLGLGKLASKLSNMISNEANNIVKERVQALVIDLAYNTPKDTGYAASRWISHENPYAVVSYNIKAKGMLVPLNTKEYIVSNDTPYIIYLNRGHSKQAPPYFIESTILSHGFAITKSIGESNV